ncbi:putative serine/threonine-protein kinase mps1-like, partial [Trifolium medium]|nr:putative serine/threonine-protein kinase mps1-like [Trifolium medium]
MDGKSNLPIKPDSSSPDFLRHVQAALKRHRPLGANDEKAIDLENLSSYMGSLGFTEMEYVEGNEPEDSIGINDDNSKQPKIQQVEADFSLRSDGGMPRRSTVT